MEKTRCESIKFHETAMAYVQTNVPVQDEAIEALRSAVVADAGHEWARDELERLMAHQQEGGGRGVGAGVDRGDE